MIKTQLQMLFITLILTTINSAPKEFTPKQTFQGNIPLCYIDGRNREPRADGTAEIDTFYDRIVSIAIYNVTKTYSNVTTGVLITPYRVLTSFNAFAILSKDKEAKDILRISILRSREVIDSDAEIGYYLNHTQVQSGRQVIPWEEEDVPSHMKHGPHRPHHDLMVIRLLKPIEALLPVPQPQTSPFIPGKHKSGPIITKIATEDYNLDDLKFVSIGHINDEHIKYDRFLEKEDIHPDDDAVVDCEKWIPREWGRFICILNVNNYAGIASGAMLFAGEKLVGVGAFALWKGENSALMFTDVRLYRELILKTCTLDDENLVVPNPDL